MNLLYLGKRQYFGVRAGWQLCAREAEISPGCSLEGLMHTEYLFNSQSNLKGRYYDYCHFPGKEFRAQRDDKWQSRVEI